MTKIKTLADLLKIKEEVQSKIKLREKSDHPEQVVQVKVGMATCGIASGAKETMKYFIDELEQQAIDAVVTQTGCMGFCYAEPTVEVFCRKRTGGFWLCHKEKAEEIIDVYIKRGELIDGIIPISFQNHRRLTNIQESL
jgi:NADP-reducing hydrogenase subunit HndB